MSKIENQDYVQVTLKLPKQIAKFIKESWSTDNLEETLTKEIVDISYSQVEVDANEKGIFPEELMKKHGLTPIFKKYGVLPSYYREDHNKISETETPQLGKVHLGCSNETETFQIPEKEYRAYENIAKKTGFKNVDELVNAAIREFIKTVVIEKEEVTIQIPKKLLKFVQVLRSNNWEKYLSDSLTDTIATDIDAEVFGKFNEVIKDFGLTEEFQFYQGH